MGATTPSPSKRQRREAVLAERREFIESDYEFSSGASEDDYQVHESDTEVDSNTESSNEVEIPEKKEDLAKEVEELQSALKAKNQSTEHTRMRQRKKKAQYHVELEEPDDVLTDDDYLVESPRKRTKTTARPPIEGPLLTDDEEIKPSTGLCDECNLFDSPKSQQRSKQSGVATSQLYNTLKQAQPTYDFGSILTPASKNLRKRAAYLRHLDKDLDIEELATFQRRYSKASGAEFDFLLQSLLDALVDRVKTNLKHVGAGGCGAKLRAICKLEKAKARVAILEALSDGKVDLILRRELLCPQSANTRMTAV